MKTGQLRLLTLVLLVMVVQAGCRPARPSVQPEPVETAEEPVLVLALAAGPGPRQPGVTPGRVGGVPEQGSLSLAPGPAGAIYLLDQARLRVLVLTADAEPGAVAMPFLGDSPHDLLVDSGRLYLRDGGLEYELTPDGRLLRLANTHRQPGLYPRRRQGEDGLGNTYHLAERTVVRRGGGRELARGQLPADVHVQDWCVGPEGEVLALSWVWADGGIVGARVHRVLGPVMALSAAPAPAPAPLEALGLPRPSRVTLRWNDWPETWIGDPVTLHNLWFFLAGVDTGDPGDQRPPAVLWPSVEVEVPAAAGPAVRLELGCGDWVRVDNDWRRAEPSFWLEHARRLLAFALQQALPPAALLESVTTARLTIPDLPGVGRPLAPEEVATLRAGLAGAFPVGPWEPPQPLEDPYPRHVLELAGEGWQVQFQLAGDHYLVTSGACGLALCDPAGTVRQVRDWLPPPRRDPDEVAYLYGASALRIKQGSHQQDLTRWKATVVRLLLGVSRPSPGLELPPGEEVTLSFSVAGEERTVVLTERGFSYADRFYPVGDLRGAILPLQGVP